MLSLVYLSLYRCGRWFQLLLLVGSPDIIANLNNKLVNFACLTPVAVGSAYGLRFCDGPEDTWVSHQSSVNVTDTHNSSGPWNTSTFSGCARWVGVLSARLERCTLPGSGSWAMDLFFSVFGLNFVTQIYPARDFCCEERVRAIELGSVRVSNSSDSISFCYTSLIVTQWPLTYLFRVTYHCSNWCPFPLVSVLNGMYTFRKNVVNSFQ